MGSILPLNLQMITGVKVWLPDRKEDYQATGLLGISS